MRRLLRDNGLSIAMFGLFFVFVSAQSVMGLLDYNSTQEEHGQRPVSYVQYLGSGDFVEAILENWESEFLQMGLYVLLTAFLFQRGSLSLKIQKPGTRLCSRWCQSGVNVTLVFKLTYDTPVHRLYDLLRKAVNNHSVVPTSVPRLTLQCI